MSIHIASLAIEERIARHKQIWQQIYRRPAVDEKLVKHCRRWILESLDTIIITNVVSNVEYSGRFVL